MALQGFTLKQTHCINHCQRHPARGVPLLRPRTDKWLWGPGGCDHPLGTLPVLGKPTSSFAQRAPGACSALQLVTTRATTTRCSSPRQNVRCWPPQVLREHCLGPIHRYLTLGHINHRGCARRFRDARGRFLTCLCLLAFPPLLPFPSSSARPAPGRVSPLGAHGEPPRLGSAAEQGGEKGELVASGGWEGAGTFRKHRGAPQGGHSAPSPTCTGAASARPAPLGTRRGTATRSLRPGAAERRGQRGGGLPRRVPTER